MLLPCPVPYYRLLHVVTHKQYTDAQPEPSLSDEPDSQQSQYRAELVSVLRVALCKSACVLAFICT